MHVLTAQPILSRPTPNIANISIEHVIGAVKKAGNTSVCAILYIFATGTHDVLLTEANHQGVAGNGCHNWLFGNSFSGILDNFELDSPLFYAYQGAGLLEVSGGVPGVAACNKYVQKMAALRNGHYLST